MCDTIISLLNNSGKIFDNRYRYFESGIISMIRIKLGELLGKHKMTRKCLAEMTGIRPNTIGDLYREDVKRIDLSALDKICEALNCEVSDILEYEKEEEDDI